MNFYLYLIHVYQSQSKDIPSLSLRISIFFPQDSYHVCLHVKTWCVSRDSLVYFLRTMDCLESERFDTPEHVLTESDHLPSGKTNKRKRQTSTSLVYYLFTCRTSDTDGSFPLKKFMVLNPRGERFITHRYHE